MTLLRKCFLGIGVASTVFFATARQDQLEAAVCPVGVEETEGKDVAWSGTIITRDPVVGTLGQTVGMVGLKRVKAVLDTVYIDFVVDGCKDESWLEVRANVNTKLLDDSAFYCLEGNYIFVKGKNYLGWDEYVIDAVHLECRKK